MADNSLSEPIDYDKLVDMFNRALISTLRKHSIADSFLDLWVPDANPVVGISSMVDSARIAGLPAITIRFRQTTVSGKALQELKQVLAKVCTVALDIEGETILLHATAMTQGSAISAEPTPHRDAPKPTYWEPGKLGDARQPDTCVPDYWKSGELPEFGDVHPHFRLGLKAAFDMLSFESAAKHPGVGLKQISAREGAIAITFNVDPKTHVVSMARHMGANRPSERAILDLFCKAAENLPIQEVADHITLKLIDTLTDKDKGPLVAGVLLPTNSGAPFILAVRLARRAYDNYRAETGTEDGINFYYPPPSQEWQTLSTDERGEKVNRILRAFLQSEGLYPDDMNIPRIDKNRYGYFVRVIVSFSDRVATANKPNLMRLLERRLRRDAEPEIDLVAERAKDTSPLRRLS